MKNCSKGFALVEVVIVIVLVAGSFLVFLEALSQAKIMQVKSEITPQSHDYVSFTDYPNYSFSLTVSYVDDQFQLSGGSTNYKMVELGIQHTDERYPIISDSFIITNAL